MDRAGEDRRSGREGRAATGRVAGAPPRTPLETERLILEPVEPRHASQLYEATVSSRPELLPWMPWARQPTGEGVLELTERDVARWADGTCFNFAVVERSGGEAIGVVGLNREGDQGRELHYWIRSDRAGRGLTTEACRALIRWATQTLGLARLTLWAGRDNLASRRVAAKLGFQHVGPLDWRPEGGMGNFEAESYELALDS